MPENQPPSASPREPPDASGDASTAGRPPGGRRRGGLLRRTLLLALLVAVIAATAVLVFPDQLLLPWLLPAVQAAARAQGLQLSVAHLRGGFSETLELQGVHVATADRSLPPVVLDVPAAELRWSPWRALTGAPDALDALVLHGGTLTVDLSQGRATSGEPWPADALATLGRRLDALPPLAADGLAVVLRAPSGGWLATPVLTVHGTLRVNGRRVEIAEATLDGDGPAGRLPGGLALREPARIDLSQLARNELPFAANVAGLGGTLGVAGMLRGQSLEAHLTANDVPLAALWRAGTGDTAPSPLDGPLHLDGDVRLPLAAAHDAAAHDAAARDAATRDTATRDAAALDATAARGAARASGAVEVGGISASARFTLGATSAWGLPLDAVSGELSWTDGALHAHDVHLSQGDNHLAIEAADVPLAAVDALTARLASAVPTSRTAPPASTPPTAPPTLATPATPATAATPAVPSVPWTSVQVEGNLDIENLPGLLAALRGAELLPAPVVSRAASIAEQLAAQSAPGDHRLVLHAALRDGTLTVRDALLATTGGSLAVPQASLDLRAPDLADAALAVQLDADFTDLAPLGALLGSQPFPGARSAAWAGTLAAHVRFSGSARTPSAELDIGARGLVAGGWPLGALTVQAVADAHELRVDALELQAEHAHVSAQGALELPGLVLRGVSARVSVPDLATALPDTGLAGELSAHAALDGPLPLPLGSLEVHVHDLLAHGVPVEDLDLSARHEPGLLTVSDAALRAPWGALRTAGELRFTEPLADLSPAAWLDAVRELRLDRLALARGSLQLLLAEPTTLTHAGGLWSGPLAFTGSAGGLRATLGATPAASGAGSLQRVQLVAENLQPLLSLPSGSSVETLDGDIDLAFGPGELSATGTLRALGLTLAADDTDLGARVVGDVTAWLAVTGSPDAPRGSVELSARQLVLTMPNRLAPQGFGPCTLDAHVTLGDVVAVDWLHVDSPHEIHLDGSGTLRLPDQPRAHWPDTAVNLRLSVSAGQLERLAELITDVRRLSGDLAADLTVEGTLGAPRAHGSVVVHDGALRLQGGGLPALNDLEASFELQGDRIAIVALTGELGSAPFTISGEALLEPAGPRLDIALRGEDLLFYRDNGVTVRADSDLAVRGPLSALSATGTLVLRNSGIVSSLNLLHLAQGGGRTTGLGLHLFSFVEPPLSTCSFDVRITAAEPFLVRNNVVRGGLRPDLRLTGTGAVPILDGTLTVEESRVILPAGSVNIDGGRVIFSAADPFVPRLDISGSARRRGYDVNVVITGPYDRPIVNLSSVPPLPSDKILLLLLAGQAPGRGAVGPAGSDTTTHVVAVYLGQDLLARWLGDSPLGEEGLLDRLEVDVVKDLSRSNTDLLQVSYRLTPLPKRGGTVTFLRAEKDLYNRINFGVQFLFRLQP